MMNLPFFHHRSSSPRRKTGVLSFRFFWYMGLVLFSITVLLSVLAYFYLAIPIGAALMMLNMLEYLCHHILAFLGKEHLIEKKEEEGVHE